MANDPVTIPPVRETLQSHGEAPLQTSSLYLHRSKHTREDGVEQNVIAGVHLVFKAGHQNNLYDAFNIARTEKLDPTKVPAKRALLIACDTLEIYGELSLPEIEVAIYARRLVFKEQGHINTTPLNWTMDRAADYDLGQQKGGANGAEGRNAGNLSVFIKEIEEPSHESIKRFICRGGRGQHAGHGRPGDNGHSLESISNFFDHWDSHHYCKFYASFANPCVFATYKWKWFLFEMTHGQRGQDGWPTDGQNALEPGRPGSGGNGGSWVSNGRDLIARLDNSAAGPGDTAPDCPGGAAGTPTTATHYDLTFHFDLDNETVKGENDLKETRSTKAGTGYTAKGSTGGSGKSATPKTIDIANAWVHPLQLESVLRYARDAFLAEARDDLSKLLAPYEAALAAPRPTSTEKSIPWTEDDAAQWNSAQAEVASTLHRLRTQLDYFGNPAGYMPFLSLQATMRLYDLETKDALRTLLLAKWVADESNKAQSAANAFGSAIEQTNKDTARVAEQLVKSEALMESIDHQLTSLKDRLTTLSTKLDTLRTELYTEAADDLQKKAAIKFGVKMAAAICQVVPVGQPVLGTIGKLASFAADIKEEGTPDTLSKMGETIKKARESANKAKKAKEEAKKKEKDPATPDEAKKSASAWAKAGDGLGPALSMAGDAIGALHVPEEEIEVELAKLIAQSKKWKEMVEQIKTLNKDKASLFNDLSEVLQAIGDGYARLASNADALVTMHSERNRALEKLSAEANQVIARLGQAARLSLQRTLYLLVKSYETTVFKTIDVDWRLDKVLDKIAELLKPNTGFNADTITKFAEAVAPLFEANKKTIKESLLKDYGFSDMGSSSLEFGFTSKQTPEILDQLRRGHTLVINPLLYGLILPTQERGKALNFTCKITFKTPLPDSGNAILSLRTAGDGTVRRGEHLYAVRSDAPRIWTWTYHFSDRTQEPKVPSISSLDLLNLLLDTSDEGIKQKLAAPPAWSDLTIDLEFSPVLTLEQRPVLESVMFVCAVESTSAASTQRILDVRAGGTYDRLQISPADLARRGDGFGDSYRIYNKTTKVTLKAPPTIGDRPFAYWEVLTGDTHRKEDKPTIDVVLDANALVSCQYKPSLATTWVIQERFGDRDAASIEAEIGDSRQAGAAVALIANNKEAQLLPPTLVQPVVIRARPGADEPIIGVTAGTEEPTVLEENAGWRKVTYKGLIGYVAR
jgi:ABC-type transporter Mla subunit MlaD